MSANQLISSQLAAATLSGPPGIGITYPINSTDAQQLDSAGIPSWSRQGTLWDTLYVAGTALPGKIDFEQGGRKYKTDKKKVVGADGATLTGLGHIPGDVLMKLTIWTGRQLQTLIQLLPMLQPPPGKGRPSPLDVSHPSLQVLGILKLYFIELGIITHRGRGKYDMRIHATEFLPVAAGNVTATPEGSLNVFAVATRNSVKVAPTPSTQEAQANPPSTDLNSVGPGVGGFSGVGGFTGFSPG